jgi:hypothetical protein
MQLYVRSESVVSRVIAGETLIVPVRKGVGDLASIYSLNEVASAIWQCVQTPRKAEDIVSTLENEFAADPQQIGRDVAVFLEEMSSAGLINAVGDAA